MASFSNKLTTATIDINGGGGVVRSSRSDFCVSQHWVPDKSNGVLLTLPNGTKFRRATNYMKFRRWLELGTFQQTNGVSANRPVSIKTSNGGYVSDGIILSSPDLKSSIGSLINLGGSPSIPSEMRNEAATKALLKIASQKAGIGEDLATFRQTLDLIHKPSSDLAKDLKRAWNDIELRPYLNRSVRDVQNMRHVSNRISEKYLQYVYGWKPLVQDIYGIMSLMKKKGSKDFLFYGNGSSQQQCQCPPITKDDISASTKTVAGPLDESAKVSCHIWARIDPNCPGLRTMNQCGLLNPFSLAWELVPWSFVIDWFVPIGSVLQALTAPAGLIFVDGSMSVRNHIVGPYQSHRTTYDAIATSNNFAGGTVRYEGWKRESLSSWPLPGLWANPTPLSGDRPLKALALMILNLRNLGV